MNTSLHHIPLTDATPKAEVGDLAVTYSFLVQHHANHKSAEKYSDDDTKIGGEQNQEAGIFGVANPQLPVQEGSDTFRSKHEDFRKEVTPKWLTHNHDGSEFEKPLPTSGSARPPLGPGYPLVSWKASRVAAWSVSTVRPSTN